MEDPPLKEDMVQPLVAMVARMVMVVLPVDTVVRLDTAARPDMVPPVVLRRLQLSTDPHLVLIPSMCRLQDCLSTVSEHHHRLWAWFTAVDADRSGAIHPAELGRQILC
jgi:hypothetical protein